MDPSTASIIIISYVCLVVFIVLFVFQIGEDKFQKVAYQIREIKRLSNPQDRIKNAFPDEVSRKEIEKLTMNEQSSIAKVIRYAIMGLMLLGFIACLSYIVRQFFGPWHPIFGKIGTGISTIGVMFVLLGSWSIQTFSNKTTAEKLRDFLLVLFWSLGTFMVFMAE